MVVTSGVVALTRRGFAAEKNRSRNFRRHIEIVVTSGVVTERGFCTAHLIGHQLTLILQKSFHSEKAVFCIRLCYQVAMWFGLQTISC